MKLNKLFAVAAFILTGLAFVSCQGMILEPVTEDTFAVKAGAYTIRTTEKSTTADNVQKTETTEMTYNLSGNADASTISRTVISIKLEYVYPDMESYNTAKENPENASSYYDTNCDPKTRTITQTANSSFINDCNKIIEKITYKKFKTEFFPVDTTNVKYTNINVQKVRLMEIYKGTYHAQVTSSLTDEVTEKDYEVYLGSSLGEILKFF